MCVWIMGFVRMCMLGKVDVGCTYCTDPTEIGGVGREGGGLFVFSYSSLALFFFFLLDWFVQLFSKNRGFGSGHD
jgi:hypothetical protein